MSSVIARLANTNFFLEIDNLKMRLNSQLSFPISLIVVLKLQRVEF